MVAIWEGQAVYIYSFYGMFLFPKLETHWGLTCSPRPSPARSRPPTAEGLALGHPCPPTGLAAPPSPGHLRLLPARTAYLSRARDVALVSVFSFYS